MSTPRRDSDPCHRSGIDGGARRVSVVTVVKDDLDGLRRTAESVMQQGLDGIEWVVVDSSMNAADPHSLVTKMAPFASYEWIPPSGVYNAMNRALDQCQGEYVWFVNAGDEIAPGSTTSAVKIALGSDPLWLIGQVAFIGADGSRTVPPPFDYERERASMFARGRFAPHQGTIVRTDWLRTHGGFDEGYLVAADYETSLRLSQAGSPVIIDQVIAEFRVGGLSAARWRTSVAEFHRARRSVLKPTGVTALREWALTGTSFAREAAGAALRRSRRAT